MELLDVAVAGPGDLNSLCNLQWYNNCCMYTGFGGIYHVLYIYLQFEPLVCCNLLERTSFDGGGG